MTLMSHGEVLDKFQSAFALVRESIINKRPAPTSEMNHRLVDFKLARTLLIVVYSLRLIDLTYISLSMSACPNFITICLFIFLEGKSVLTQLSEYERVHTPGLKKDHYKQKKN
jgi:hypothetical protein